LALRILGASQQLTLSCLGFNQIGTEVAV
jgi:hypothetical protein